MRVRLRCHRVAQRGKQVRILRCTAAVWTQIRPSEPLGNWEGRPGASFAAFEPEYLPNGLQAATSIASRITCRVVARCRVYANGGCSMRSIVAICERRSPHHAAIRSIRLHVENASRCPSAASPCVGGSRANRSMRMPAPTPPLRMLSVEESPHDDGLGAKRPLPPWIPNRAARTPFGESHYIVRGRNYSQEAADTRREP